MKYSQRNSIRNKKKKQEIKNFNLFVSQFITQFSLFELTKTAAASVVEN